MSTALANHLQLLDPELRNVFPSSFHIKGISGGGVYCPLLRTSLQLGENGSRYMPILVSLIPSNEYKLLLGHNVLIPLDYEINSKRRHLIVNGKANNGQTDKYILRLLTKDQLADNPALQTFQAWVKNNASTRTLPEQQRDETEDTLPLGEAAYVEVECSMADRIHLTPEREVNEILVWSAI